MSSCELCFLLSLLHSILLYDYTAIYPFYFDGYFEKLVFSYVIWCSYKHFEHVHSSVGCVLGVEYLGNREVSI